MEMIQRGLFPEWVPRMTLIYHAFEKLTFLLSPYELAAAKAGNAELVKRIFNDMLPILRDNAELTAQRPSKELLVCMAKTYKHSLNPVEPQSEDAPDVEDVRRAVRYAYDFLPVQKPSIAM